MFLIAHRGNINGPELDNENKPDYIINAVRQGYDVELDVWWEAGSFYLGHNKPKYPVDSAFLYNEGLWCHAKNLDALERMLRLNVHCFWQDKDDYALTSKGYIFTHSGITTETDKSIIVSLDGDLSLDRSAGVCSDYIFKYKK